jgi:hypothetical protein
MTFPTYVHAVIPSADPSRWPVAPQGTCECDFAATANALNLLLGERRYSKDAFIRAAGPLFQPRLGGTISPLKVWQLRRRGYGTHFGNLSRTNGERVLRDLVDRGIPTIVELGVAFQVAQIMIYGLHSVVLVGYSDPYPDAQGQLHEDYYVVDSQWPVAGPFDLHSNDLDRDGDGVAENFPGKRTLSRDEFRRLFRTGLYCPVFLTPAAHDAWYRTLGVLPRVPVLGWLNQTFFSGSYDRWRTP